MLEFITTIPDEGLILDHEDASLILWREFSKKVQKRSHNNFEENHDLFTKFLLILFYRRKLKVMSWMEQNLKKFRNKRKSDASDEDEDTKDDQESEDFTAKINAEIKLVESSFSPLKAKMTVCTHKWRSLWIVFRKLLANLR